MDLVPQPRRPVSEHGDAAAPMAQLAQQFYADLCIRAPAPARISAVLPRLINDDSVDESAVSETHEPVPQNDHWS